MEEYTIPSLCPVCGRKSNQPIPFCPRCNYGIDESCPEFVEVMDKYFPPMPATLELSDMISSIYTMNYLDDLILKGE